MHDKGKPITRAGQRAADSLAADILAKTSSAGYGPERPAVLEAIAASLVARAAELRQDRRPARRGAAVYSAHAPLDPECPDNHVAEALSDPITVAYGIGDELGPDLEARHRATCKRCQEYGAANIEVDGP